MRILCGTLVSFGVLVGIVVVLALYGVAVPQTSWAAIGSIATAAAAVVGVWTLMSLRQDSLDRTRPVIVAEFQQNVLSDATELLIRNVGPSIAKNVSFTFDPELPVLADARATVSPIYFFQRRYSRTIPTFGPGMARQDVYCWGHNPDDGAPADFELTIDYDDAHRRHYTDVYELSLMAVRDTSVVSPQGDTPEKLHRRTTRAIEAIARGVGRR